MLSRLDHIQSRESRGASSDRSSAPSSGLLALLRGSDRLTGTSRASRISSLNGVSVRRSDVSPYDEGGHGARRGGGYHALWRRHRHARPAPDDAARQPCDAVYVAHRQRGCAAEGVQDQGQSGRRRHRGRQGGLGVPDSAGAGRPDRRQAHRGVGGAGHRDPLDGFEARRQARHPARRCLGGRAALQGLRLYDRGRREDLQLRRPERLR